MTRDLSQVDFGQDDMPGAELHEVLHAYRAEGPIRPTRLNGLPAYIITAHDALLDAFMDTERFPPHLMYRARFEPAIGESFISMPERERHLLYRKLATPAFRSRAMTRFEKQGLAALAHEVADRLEGRDEVDLLADFAARFPYLVITRLLGIPHDREEDFHAWALALLLSHENPQRAREAAKQFTETLAPIVEARRQEPRDDVISELLAAEVEGRQLTDPEIYAHIRLLFPTGGETTHASLGNLLYTLLSDAGSWQRLRAEPRLVDAAVQELLRWETPIAVLPRLSCDRPVDFCGVRIPADSWVLFGIAGANRDPAVFPDPDRFDLDRENKEGLTFGRGVKSCPGIHLARSNLRTGLEVLLERLPLPTLIDKHAAQPRRSVLRCPDALRVSTGR